MRPTIRPLVTLVFCLLSGRLEAQQNTLLHASPLWSASPRLASPALDTGATVKESQSYWKEGLIIGAGLGGAFGAVVSYGMCSESETDNSGCVGKGFLGLLVGAAIGAAPGALIGGVFPKHPRSSPDGTE
jgi:hypothetical protein